MDDVPDTDDADAPIIVPRPNQILRRAARTKIRKPGLPGDGNGHRFPATRRKPSARTETADSVGDKGENESERPPVPAQASKSDEFVDDMSNRRMTYTEESSIYDAYADSVDEKENSFSSDASHSQALYDSPVSPTSTAVHLPEITPPQIAEPEPEPELVMQPQPQPILYQPQPQRHLTPVVQQHPTQSPSRTPSPDGSTTSHHEDARRPSSRSTEYLPYHSPSPTISEKRKGKDKKGLLGKFGVTDKSSKKVAKEGKEKEKESGFFGSFFGGGKKKQEEPAPTNIGGGAGPATAAALLGASKSSKSYQPPVSPVLLGGSPYARYPIHVERAVYRLSHIKLANPRRPLYEQVLISNLMFWYLGVINKTQQGPGQANQQNQQQQQAQADGQSEGQDNGAAKGIDEDHVELERKEMEEREARERVERERESMERVEPRKEPRRGSLTKSPAPGGAVSANRRAEMPVKGPQYGLQHQVIEQEYGNGPPSLGSSSPPLSRTSSAPSPSNHSPGYSQRPYSPSQSRQPGGSAPTTYAHVDENGDFYYEQASPSNNRIPNGPTRRSTSPGLPPGAMAPMSSAEHMWMSSASTSESDHHSARSTSTSPPRSNSVSSYDVDGSNQPRPRPVRSPPPANQASPRNGVDWEGAGSGGKPSRSLSANAVAPSHSGQSRHHHNHGNALKKKAPSASVATPSAGAVPARRPRTADGEEEDVPLAVWQQRRK